MSRVRVNKLGDAALGEKFAPFTLRCRLTVNAVDTTDGIDQIGLGIPHYPPELCWLDRILGLTVNNSIAKQHEANQELPLGRDSAISISQASPSCGWGKASCMINESICTTVSGSVNRCRQTPTSHPVYHTLVSSRRISYRWSCHLAAAVPSKVAVHREVDTELIICFRKPHGDVCGAADP